MSGPPPADGESAPAPPAAPEPVPEPVPPEVQPAAELFERGDFRSASAALERLLAVAPGDEVARAARGLLARMAPDPWALRIGLGALALLALVSILYVL